MNSSKIIHNSSEFNSYLKALNASSIVVLTDSNTTKNCLVLAESSALLGLEYQHIELAPGEGTKSLDSANGIWEKLIDLNVDRNAVMVCLGGGMICDLGGYAASCFKRGIRTAYIPTTNLAMTDAALGGKTGVNFGIAKNQIGTFHLPEFVLIDSEYLNTLSNRELCSGFAETIKHALIADRQLWMDLALMAEPWNDMSIIKRSSSIKINIIEKDFNDNGARQALNFGHTIGHGIEAASHKTATPLLHGEAVLYGIVGEAWLSNHLQLITQVELQEILDYISIFTKPTQLPEMDSKNLFDAMTLDKKNSNGNIVFSLISGIGFNKLGIRPETSHIEQALNFTINFSKN